MNFTLLCFNFISFLEDTYEAVLEELRIIKSQLNQLQTNPVKEIQQTGKPAAHYLVYTE